jgi:DNA repair protein RecO (recombination protein O)
MDWQEPAIVLSSRPHGDSSAVVQVISAHSGKYAGYSKGGMSKNRAAIWQTGNMVEAKWTARISDQLGSISGEMAFPTASVVMNSAISLAIVSSSCALTEIATPDRVPSPSVFSLLAYLISEVAADDSDQLVKYIRWEASLLAECGFALDLRKCAVTGSHEDLIWVSPKTGRSVCRSAGAPYANRLLRLPEFMANPQAIATAGDIQDGLRLTGHFIARNILHGGACKFPLPRSIILQKATAATKPDFNRNIGPSGPD